MRNRGLCSTNPSRETPALGEQAGPGRQRLHSPSCEPLSWTRAGSGNCFVSVQGAEKEGGTRALSERHMIKSWAFSRLDNLLLAKTGLLGSVTEILHVNSVGKSSH